LLDLFFRSAKAVLQSPLGRLKPTATSSARSAKAVLQSPLGRLKPTATSSARSAKADRYKHRSVG